MRNILLLFSISILLIQKSVAQPTEYYSGRYDEVGMNYGNPYTMFNKTKGAWQDQLANLRLNILNKVEPYASLYHLIYQNAIKSEPSSSGYAASSEIGPLPAWTKDNAIVSLVGIKDSINSLQKDTFITMNTTENSVFATNALQGFEDMDYNVVAC